VGRSLVRQKKAFSANSKRPSLSRSRVTADALDHGAHAVRALWRKMLLEAQPAKSALGVDGENLLRRAIEEYRDRDRD
jgi:hypothetical protein